MHTSKFHLLTFAYLLPHHTNITTAKSVTVKVVCFSNAVVSND